MSERERPRAWYAPERDALRAERDSLIIRVSREQEFRAAVTKALDVPDGGRYVNDTLSRIESLVGEREELRELAARLVAALNVSKDEPSYPEADYDAIDEVGDALAAILDRSVLSSRETTDPKPTSSDGADTKSKPDSLGETTDSPTCPSCGLGVKRVMGGYETCTDTFHSTDNGKD